MKLSSRISSRISSRFPGASLVLWIAAATALATLGTIAACGDDNAVKETVPQDSGPTDGQTSSTTDGSSLPGTDGSIIVGPDGAVFDDCVAKPDPNVYTDLLNACTTSYKLDPHPVIPLLFPDGGLPPLP